MDFWTGAMIMVDKPYGITSFKVVHDLRRNISAGTGRKLKIGHAGTLDPLASGLLILCTGKMTREIDSYQGLVKCYTGTFRLGQTTPTYDLESDTDFEHATDHIDDAAMEAVRLGFMGEQWMTPPIHSAVQIGGKRAYELARQGKTPELAPKRIVIDSLEIRTADFPDIHFRVVCSKGTYIRALAHEFGRRLQSGAHLTALRRESIGPYDVQQAWDFETLKKLLLLQRER